MVCWYFTAAELKQTPSIVDGCSPEDESVYRREGAGLVIQISNSLGLSYGTVATGVVFFHRFYMLHSFRQFDRYVTACACLFLAGKVEETPKKCKDIIKVARTLLSSESFVVFGDDAKEEVLILERVLLQTIKFDLQLEHPYMFLIKYAKCLKGDKHKLQRCVQMAWTFVNDSLCTTLCIQWEPEIIAIALLYLAGKLCKFEVIDWIGRRPQDLRWWDVFVEDMPMELLEDVCHQVLDVYTQSNRVSASTMPSSISTPAASTVEQFSVSSAANVTCIVTTVSTSPITTVTAGNSDLETVTMTTPVDMASDTQSTLNSDSLSTESQSMGLKHVSDVECTNPLLDQSVHSKRVCLDDSVDVPVVVETAAAAKPSPTVPSTTNQTSEHPSNSQPLLPTPSYCAAPNHTTFAASLCVEGATSIAESVPSTGDHFTQCVRPSLAVPRPPSARPHLQQQEVAAARHSPDAPHTQLQTQQRRAHRPYLLATPDAAYRPGLPDEGAVVLAPDGGVGHEPQPPTPDMMAPPLPPPLPENTCNVTLPPLPSGGNVSKEFALNKFRFGSLPPRPMSTNYGARLIPPTSMFTPSYPSAHIHMPPTPLPPLRQPLPHHIQSPVPPRLVIPTNTIGNPLPGAESTNSMGQHYY